MNKNIFRLTFGVALLSICFASCKEDIDESARYTFKQETVTDYLHNHEQYSEFAKLIDEVMISSHSKSTVSKLLSARGNFVVFAPTNEAIERYLDSVSVKGIIPAGTKVIENIADDMIADSLKKVIVYNAVVDFSEYQSVFQYISDIAPQPSGDVKKPKSKTMVYSNMNNRFLTIVEPFPLEIKNEAGEVVTTVTSSYTIEDAHTYKCDIQVYNGIVHEMYEVVAPNNDNMVDVLGKCDAFSAFSDLVSLCGISDQLTQQEDEVYHELYWSNPAKYAPPSHATQGSGMKPFEQRLIGFTAFIETNDVYEQMGVLGADGKVDLEKLRQYLLPLQPSDLSQGTDYESKDNWLNFFVTYHILPMAIDFDYLVIHYNELGYIWSDKNCKPTIVQTEHYTTMGRPRLLNISEGSDTVVNGTQGKRINYFAKTYRSNTNPFTVQELYNQGILIANPTSMNIDFADPVNGKIYPITEPLIYTPQIAKWQGTMRMRIDVAALFPELMTNRIRRRYNNIGDYGFTKNYQFLENMTWSDDSNVYYFPGYASQWHNYQGDEFNITGIYDLTIKMPPIPYSTTYELRMGVSVNPTRGMMQVYYGTNPNSLPAAGIPLDMRMGGTTRYQDWNGAIRSNSNVGWEEDGDDEQLNDEVDKKMRLQGFMKAPAGFAKLPVVGQIDVANSMRNNCESYGHKGNAIRRIVVRQEMEEGETYYIRFKSVLDNKNSQFFLDYFELVPKEVYDNPLNPEDIW